LGGIRSYRNDTTLTLEIQAKASVPSIAQVFFDTGRGFNEKDSQAIHVAGSGIFQSLDFPVPHKPVRGLRFDPLTGPGTVLVRGIAVFDGARRLIVSFRPEALVGSNEVRIQRVAEGALIEAVPNARDPVTIIPVERPVASAIDAGAVAVQRGVVWFLVVASTALVLSAPGVRDRWCDPARLVLRFLSSDPAATGEFSRFDLVALLWLLGVLALAHVIRAPRLFIDPRFWAEEGTIWFQHGVTHSAVSTLLFVFRDSGYLTLFSNISAILASLWASVFGLKFAPLVTTVCAFFVQLLCLVFILWGRSRLTDAWWKRIVVCCIVLFSPVVVGEIWLNTINSPSYFGLMTLLLLFQDPSAWTNATRWSVRGLLIVCGLTGVYSALLFPLFVVAFFLYKTREHLYQAAVLAVCFTSQVGITLFVRSGAGLEQSRFSQISVGSAVVNAFFNHIAVPCLGFPGAQVLFHWFGMDDALAAATAVPRGGGLVLAAWFSFLLMVLVLAVICRHLTKEKALLIACFLLYSVLTTIASLNGLPGGRYAYLPGTVMLILLLVAAASAPARWIRVACVGVLAISLSYGLATYRHDPSFLPDAWGAPSWSGEVLEWHHNTQHRLRVWPSWWAGRISLVSASVKTAKTGHP
jgi:hypothetical protein